MWIRIALILCSFTFTDGSERNNPPPHIIFILGDDMGYNDVGWTNPKMPTPNMNRMAREGIILNHFYAMPQCTPSRATMLSGRYAQELGLQRGVLNTQEAYGIPTDFKLLPEILKRKANYRTHAIGKWHLGFCSKEYTPVYRGFDTFRGFWQGAEENYQHCISNESIYDPPTNCAFDFRNNMTDVHEEYLGDFSTFAFNDAAVSVIENHPPSKPLFMYAAFTATHFPVQAPDEFVENCGELPKERRIMCGAVNSLDKAIANITDALKRTGLYDNSVIVFTSDNGGNYHFGANNYPLRGNKASLWEGGTRVPAFVHSPLLQNTGYNYTGLIHMVDWYTTFLYLAGIRPDKSLKLRGKNQWKALSQRKKSPRTSFPYSVDILNGTWIAAVRVKNYKLIAGPGGTSDKWVTDDETVDMSFNSTYVVEYETKPLPFDLTDRTSKLFDLSVDPFEKNDIAASNPDIVRRLWRKLRYYINMAEPAVKLPQDPAGDPANFDNVYSDGWCKAYKTVPQANNKQYSNQNIATLYLQ